jgi:ribose 1,5-bisphosphate isomerase
MDSECARIISKIKNLEIQGATSVARAAMRCLEITARKSRAKTRDAYLNELEGVGKKLVSARATEPTLRNAVSTVILRVKLQEDIKAIRRVTLSECGRYMRDLREMIEKVADIGSDEIDDGDVVFTHCHSRHVVEILKKARRKGKGIEVIVTESRPKNQGIKTAKELLEAGIKVTYCTDSACGIYMKRATKMLVGCDAILDDGSVVNKTGTFPMALVAKRFGVPVIVAGGTYKFDQQTILDRPEPIEFRDPKEIINPRKLPKARILNPAFDITPAEFIHSIVTEKGITKPQWIRELVEVENPI